MESLEKRVNTKNKLNLSLTAKPVCLFCNESNIELLHRHHVLPWSRGESNTIILCVSCHRKLHKYVYDNILKDNGLYQNLLKLSRLNRYLNNSFPANSIFFKDFLRCTKQLLKSKETPADLKVKVLHELNVFLTVTFQIICYLRKTREENKKLRKFIARNIQKTEIIEHFLHGDKFWKA